MSSQEPLPVLHEGVGERQPRRAEGAGKKATGLVFPELVDGRRLCGSAHTLHW